MTQARDLADGKFDTDTLVVDAANNRVGVGTASPANSVEILAANPTIRLTDTNVSNQYSTISGNAGSVAIKADQEDSTTGSIRFFVGGSEKGRFLEGGGLTFNGDTAAANALDDYEESTYSFAERNGQAPITTNRCRVVKIGALVYIDGSFTVGSNSNAGTLNINLPFASTINNNGLGGGSIGFSNLSTSIIEANLRPNIENLADNLFFRYGSNNFVTCSVASGKRIDFNVWYPVL